MKTGTAEKANDEAGIPGHIPLPGEAIKIEYFTDPLCCWSWAMHEHLQKLLQAYGPLLRIEYRMGGLLESWKNYRDELNAVYTPTQMGPLWAYTAQSLDVRIDADIWVNDPPASSYPACMAVKCMQLQSDEAGAQYLYRLREAVMTRQQNIAREKVLLQVAHQLANEEVPGFNLSQFEEDLEEGRGKETFGHDLAEKNRYGITRLPTLVMKHGATTISMTGYRRLDQLAQAVNYLRHNDNTSTVTSRAASA